MFFTKNENKLLKQNAAVNPSLVARIAILSKFPASAENWSIVCLVDGSR
jgi:hypothetical protein